VERIGEDLRIREDGGAIAFSATPRDTIPPAFVPVDQPHPSFHHALALARHPVRRLAHAHSHS